MYELKDKRKDRERRKILFYLYFYKKIAAAAADDDWKVDEQVMQVEKNIGL